MSFVSELEPRALWSHFDEILKIPRASKKEERIREYVVGIAKKHGLEYKVDDAGNVVVKKPGTSGHENAPATVLQGHLDMVQEKNSDKQFDFDSDAIVPMRIDPDGTANDDGVYLTADGTTLGSDNGVGVAAMLAVLEATDLVHGPLEFLFTVDEETGLTGAGGLAGNMLDGRQLINCDSEEEGVLTIGCAGGADSHLHLPLVRSAVPAGSTALALRLSGLKGGHSGIDIHLQRGNAIRMLARALHAGFLKEGAFGLASFAGGSAHNAIPREATATVVVPESTDAATLSMAIQVEFQAAREEIRSADPGPALSIGKTEVPAECWDDDTTTRVLALLVGLPHGVLSMSYDIEDLVETSTNLAVVGEKDGKLSVLMSTRSSVASALEATRRRLRATATLAGAQIEEEAGYPGWKPDVDSRMLKVVKGIHEELAGQEPEVGAVHAGLECGIIGEKYPGMDMISFGPQIEFPHSPDERCKIPSVATFYELLKTTLERLAK